MREGHLVTAINACLELRQQRRWLDAGDQSRLRALAEF